MENLIYTKDFLNKNAIIKTKKQQKTEFRIDMKLDK